MKYVTAIASLSLVLSLPLVLTGCGSDSGGAASDSYGGACSDGVSENQGACEGAGNSWCDHECPESGVRTCTDSTVQNCVDLNGDGCLELQFAAQCIDPEICQAGVCIAPGTGGGTDATGGGTDATGGGGGGSGLACELMPPHESEPLAANCDDPSCPCGVLINTVTGIIHDGDGVPVAGAKAQVCSRSARDASMVCLAPVDTNADGTFTLSVPEGNTCMREAVMRALKPNENYSTAYCGFSGDALAAPNGVLDLTSTPSVIHATTPLLNPPAPDYDWGEAYTVEFEGGLEVDIVASTYFNSALGIEPMAATWIEGTDHLCDAHGIEGAPGVWAFSPEGDIFKTTSAARIPAPDLADGTVVNLFIQGGIGHTTWEGEEKTECEEGVWTHFACATVEGGVITVEGDSGLPSIGWLAYVPAE